MSSTFGILNPLRYRGYVYDTGYGYYYLQSRYYDPYTGRFLNPDAFTSTGQGIIGNNMFAYCGNEPIANQDSTGFLFEKNAGGGGFGGGNNPPPRGRGGQTTAIPKSQANIGILAISALGATIITFTVVDQRNEQFAMREWQREQKKESSAFFAKSGKKKSKRSGKERSTDKPSFVSSNDIDPNKSAQENATIILDEVFGKGNWNKGPNTPFNQIVKWIHRSGLFAVYLYMSIWDGE